MKKLTRIKNKLTAEDVNNITFDRSYDISVIGLGTAGGLAIIAAAEAGKKVLGVEKANYMGGVGTGGGIHIYYFGGTDLVQTPIDRQTIDLSNEFGEKCYHGFHPEAKKIVLEQQAIALGADLEFSSTVIAVYKENNRVVGFALKTADGILNIQSKFVIDCSGDAEFSILAGSDFEYGSDFNNESQPYSAPRAFISKEGKIKGANFDAGYVDTKCANAISEAIVNAHSIHLKDTFTEEDRYVCLNPHLGIREGCFIKGEERMVFSDYLNRKEVSKPVMEFYSHHDNHSKDWAFESITAQEWVVVCGLWRKETTGFMPMGALVPKGIDGLFVAGRCISIDHDTAQSFRMQRDMQKTGIIAAMMADECIDKNINWEQIEYNSFLEKLKEKNIYPKKPIDNLEPISDKALILESFKKLEEGFALWSCKLLSSEIEDFLIENLKHEDQNVSCASALALGLRRNKIALEKLREMVITRNKTLFSKGSYLKPFYLSALFLLGEMGDKDSVDIIKSILSSPEYHFENITFACLALYKIANQNQAIQKDLMQYLKAFINRADFNLPMEMQGSNVKSQVVMDRKDLLEKLVS